MARCKLPWCTRDSNPDPVIFWIYLLKTLLQGLLVKRFTCLLWSQKKIDFENSVNLDPWPRSPGIWPCPGPRSRDPVDQIGHVRACWKDLISKMNFSWVTMVTCACGLLLNPARFPIFQNKAWWYSIDHKFHTDDANPRISISSAIGKYLKFLAKTI
jgi:hypothetical protein